MKELTMTKPVLIIAEAGVNHNGSVVLAKQLIDAAADAGVDYVKFQTWITEDIIDINAPKAQYQLNNDGNSSQFEMLKRLELSFDDFRELKRYCGKAGVKFLSTPDDYRSLDFLADELQLALIKVGSGEVTNIPFLRRIGAKRKDIILSTGMATLEEVKVAYGTLKQAGAESITLLHCTSNYPAPYDSINLKAMLHIKDVFGADVGYSDHTMGNEVALAAVALGAVVIEKHFTTDVNLPGPDHKASMSPEELKSLVLQIRHIEQALSGDGIKSPHASELETKKVVSRGIYLNRDVQAGEVITHNMLIMKRPVGEVPAGMYDQVIGKKIRNTLKKGTALKLKDISID